MPGAAVLPEEQRQALRHARRLEVVWILVLGSIVAAVYLATGSSQAMKTAWIEDLLSFVPPVAFLVSSWIEGWPPNERFPRGFVRVTSIGYLVSAVALAGVGLYLVADSCLTLIHREHPTVGSVEIFGATVWFGWVMLAVLAYSAVLPVIFGRLKMRPAHKLHDKILYADALMNKADWMTGAAAMVGILGIGFGLWWADAVAAILIAADVLYDGVKHTGAAMRDLSDERPRTIEDDRFDPLVDAVQDHLERLPWVADSRLRLRQDGRFLGGTVYLAARDGDLPTRRVEETEAQLRALNWRIRDVSITPRSRLDDGEPGELRRDAGR